MLKKRYLVIFLICFSTSLSAEENDNFFSSSEEKVPFERWSDSVPDSTPRLDRLFTTRQEREALDRNRRDYEPDYPAPPQYIKFDGIAGVNGDSNRVHVWINGSPGFQHESVSIRVNKDRRSITVTLVGYGRSYRLLVGQTLDTANGQVVEFYK